MNRSSIARLATLMAAVAAALLAFASPALAATIDVDTTVDEDGTPTNGKCALREAVIAANDDMAVDTCATGTGSDTINVPAGNYTLSIPGEDEDDAATGDLDITDATTINGAATRTTTVDGSDLDRVFDVSGGTTKEISRLTITDGAAPGGDGGGGVRNSGGGLKLRRVAVDANTAASNGGGVSGSGGTLEVVDTTVSGNSATAAAGGIRQDGGRASIINSTVSGNHATLNGGVTAAASTVDIESSTIASNTSSSAGGGLLTSGLGFGHQHQELDRRGQRHHQLRHRGSSRWGHRLSRQQHRQRQQLRLRPAHR